MTSLPAHVYLNAYYPDTEHQMRKASEGPLNELKKFELVDVAALQSTWPEGEWEEPHEEPEAISMTELERELPSQMRTLTGRSMDRLIDSLMDEPDNLTSSILLEAEHLRSFLPRLRHRIYEQASTLNSSEGTYFRATCHALSMLFLKAPDCFMGLLCSQKSFNSTLARH